MAASAVTDVASFKAFLRDRARETWDERGSPYYLSFVATDLKKLDVNYHDFTGPLRLVQWAARESIPETRLVSHPTQKAKVGFVPADVTFEFSEEDEGTTSKRESGTKRGQALVNFVQSLSGLPDSVAEEFSIPAKVLLALLKQ